MNVGTKNMNSLVLSLYENAPTIVFVLTSLWLLYNRYQNSLRKIPGPFLSSCTRIPRFMSVVKGEMYKHDIELHKKYGKVVRLAPKLISVSDPAEINQILGVSSKFCKSSFYKPFEVHDAEGRLPDPFVLTDKAEHSRMRKNGSIPYSMQGALEMEPLLHGVTERLNKILSQEYADQDKICDIGFLLHCYALDAIFQITFGQDIALMEKGDTHKILSTMETFMNYAACMGQMPFLHKFLLGNSFVARLFFGENTVESEIMGVSNNQMAEARRHWAEGTVAEGPPTFLARLLQTQKSKPELITDRELMTHIFGNVTAGADTTAIAMRSIIYFVLRDPSIHKKLVDEVRNAELAVPIGYQAADALPLLNAVIKEAMRIHSPVGLMISRRVPAGGATIDGFYMPEGTEVGISPWVTHYNQQLFPEPEKFRPERWQTKDSNQLALMNRSFLSFGAGPHTCAGRHISIVEITKIMAELFVRYDMSLAEPNKEWSFSCRWFTPQKGCQIRIKKAKRG